jgi:hypothetical protein
VRSGALNRIDTVQHGPRHPEVNQESTTRLEADNQILAATVDGGHAFALELGGHLLGVERARQPAVEDLDVLEAAADERRLEAAPDGLDLWELWHGASLVRPDGQTAAAATAG